MVLAIILGVSLGSKHLNHIYQNNTQKSVSKNMKQDTENSSFANSSQKEENKKSFNKEAVAKGYYLESKDSKGKISYEKATEASLQELEGKAQTSKLSVYQTTYQGKLITVLSLP